MAYLFLIGAFIANGLANVLLKMGADKGVIFDASLGVVRLISHHAYLLGGIVLFVLNIGLYIVALRAFPLSVAYPIMVGMSFLIANTAAVAYLHEPIAWQQLVGYALILGGITLVVSYGR
jgi:multidrug transporter EmrE-like cation transporter